MQPGIFREISKENMMQKLNFKGRPGSGEAEREREITADIFLIFWVNQEDITLKESLLHCGISCFSEVAFDLTLGCGI